MDLIGLQSEEAKRLALVEQFTVRYAPIPAGLAMGVPLVLLIVFLLVRPTGLLKAREARA